MTDPPSPAQGPRTSFEIAVFDDPCSPLASDFDAPAPLVGDLYAAAPALGAAEVILYTDDHAATLPALGTDRIEALVHVWADRYRELGARAEVRYVLIFEDRGEAVGVARRHPHGNVWGFPEIPARVRSQLGHAAEHLATAGTCVICDVVAREQSDGVRLVVQNDSFIAHVPFAARFSYEVHVASKRHAPSLLDLSDPERRALADLLTVLLRGYDRLFGFPLPYVMAIQQAPTDDGGWEPVSHLRSEFTPVQRTAETVKVLAGPELGAGVFVNDVRPETSAATLRRALAGEPPSKAS